MQGPRARARFLRNRAAVAGAWLVAALAAVALVGPLVVGHDPNVSDFEGGISALETPAGPSAAHWLGTDRLFRDELARLVFGARLSLFIGVAATLIAATFGALVGVVSGYYAGARGLRVPWPFLVAAAGAVVLVVLGRPASALGVLAGGALAWRLGARGRTAALQAGVDVNADTALMRLVDVGLSFPFLLLVMAVGAALDRTTTTSILATLGLTGWLGIARLLRAKTMQITQNDYVVAARALGQSTVAILVRHVLPNVAGPLIVVATMSVAQMIVAESVLSYLGVGVSPPVATWGHMLFEGQDVYQTAPWLLAGPGVAILLAVFGFNLLGEGLRDALDPRED